MKRLHVVTLFAAVLLAACDGTTEDKGTYPVDDSTHSAAAPTSTSSTSSSSTASSSSVTSSSSGASSSSASSSSISISWVSVAAGSWTRNTTIITQTAFKISATEITQSQYSILMDTLPVQKISGDSMPVANVTWYEAALFCNALSKRLGLDTAYSYDSIGTAETLINVFTNDSVNAVRLPTEAEWEYAARAGTTTDYYWGNAVATAYAFYASTTGYERVASLKPNAWGLYDVSGNVAEWCSDWYGAYDEDAMATDPTGPSSGTKRVFRGGSWNSGFSSLASDVRESALPSAVADTRGFRIVLFPGK